MSDLTTDSRRKNTALSVLGFGGGFRAYARDHFVRIQSARLFGRLIRGQQYDLGIGVVIGAHHHIHHWVIGESPAAPATIAAIAKGAPAPERIRRAIRNGLIAVVGLGVAGIEYKARIARGAG